MIQAAFKEFRTSQVVYSLDQTYGNMFGRGNIQSASTFNPFGGSALMASSENLQGIKYVRSGTPTLSIGGGIADEHCRWEAASQFMTLLLFTMLIFLTPRRRCRNHMACGRDIWSGWQRGKIQGVAARHCGRIRRITHYSSPKGVVQRREGC